MRSFVFSSLLVLVLSGCAPIWDPTFMPAGYAHHGNVYKSQPGPEARPIGYKYSAEENAAVVEGWRHAVADLLLRAKANDLHPADPVYLTTNMGAGPSQSTFDLALREELSAAGYVLVRDEAAGKPLFYSAARALAEDGESEKTELTLGLLDDKGDIVQSVSGLYDVPLHRSGFSFAGKSFLPAVTAQAEDERGDYND